jgi:hypothetical protein
MSARIWISGLANLALAVLGVLLFVGAVTAGVLIGIWLRGV